MAGLRTTCAACAFVVALPATVAAQDAAPGAPSETGDALTEPAAANGPVGAEVYTPADFARFAPRNALDMLRQVPGFTIVTQDQGRGLGQANDNVLIDGERVSSKSDSL